MKKSINKKNSFILKAISSLCLLFFLCISSSFAQIYARIAYRNPTSSGNVVTTNDIFIEFYEDALCTTPTTPDQDYYISLRNVYSYEGSSPFIYYYPDFSIYIPSGNQSYQIQTQELTYEGDQWGNGNYYYYEITDFLGNGTANVGGAHNHPLDVH